MCAIGHIDRNVGQVSTDTGSGVVFVNMALLFLRMLVVVVLCAAAPAVAVQMTPQNPAGPARTPWEQMPSGEREVLLQMLSSSDWPFRVFGLERLQRYEDGEVLRLLGNAIKDPQWQVRCFALRQAQQMGIVVTPSDLASETDGRVIRAALQHGVAIPNTTVAPAARKLMRSQVFDDVMLGIELAAATDDDTLRNDAAVVVKRIILNMNDALAAYLGKRLSRVVGLSEPMRTARTWRDWLNMVRGEIVFAAPPAKHDPLAGTSFVHEAPIIAEMDSAEFIRLIDYLTALRQRDLDVAIAMDSTSSMLPMVSEARAGVDSLIQFLSDLSHTMRFGFVAYRDHDNPPVCQHHELSDEIQSIRAFLFSVRITGGADYPEAVLDGLERCAELNFRGTAERQIILVGDAPPHARDGQRLLRVLEHFSETGITVHAVHVPMEFPEQYTRGLSADQALASERFLEQYNESTARAFSEIADQGAGRFMSLKRAEHLVPAVMHFSINRHWWPVFDDFYEQYLELCR